MADTHEPRRARRRRDLARMKARARRYDPGYEKAFYRANHLAFCSKPLCCGNPRRYWNKLTAAELRADVAVRDEY